MAKVKINVEVNVTEKVAATVREWKQTSDTGNPRDNGPMYEYVSTDGFEYNTTKVLEQNVHVPEGEAGTEILNKIVKGIIKSVNLMDE